MHELKEKLMNELLDYSKGDITHGTLEVIDKLAHALKNLCKIEMMWGECTDYAKEGSEVISELETVLEKLKNM